MKERTSLLREAAKYSVSLFKNKFKELCDKNAIIFIEDCGVFVLRREYYSDDTGVTDFPCPTDFLVY